MHCKRVSLLSALSSFSAVLDQVIKGRVGLAEVDFLIIVCESVTRGMTCHDILASLKKHLAVAEQLRHERFDDTREESIATLTVSFSRLIQKVQTAQKDLSVQVRLLEEVFSLVLKPGPHGFSAPRFFETLQKRCLLRECVFIDWLDVSPVTKLLLEKWALLSVRSIVSSERDAFKRLLTISAMGTPNDPELAVREVESALKKIGLRFDMRSDDIDRELGIAVPYLDGYFFTVVGMI